MKKVTLVMLALAAVMQLPAQEQGRTLSLEEALEMTLSDNPAIRAAEFNRRAAQQGNEPPQVPRFLHIHPLISDTHASNGFYRRFDIPPNSGRSGWNSRSSRR